MYFVGIDLGSSYTKAVLVNMHARLLSCSVVSTGYNFEIAEKISLAAILKKNNLIKENISCIVSTGIGRNNCKSSNFSKTEISCIAKGCSFYYKKKCFAIDIGGQDNKIIKLDNFGKQIYFKMNRKCASGTGSFLEEIAFKMKITTEEMNSRAKETKESVDIGNYCTVFTGTEIMYHIKNGKSINAVLRGVYLSVVKKILEMDTFNETAVLSGGAIFKNSTLVEIFKEKIKHVIVSPNPQLTGAIGASIYGIESKKN